MISLAAALIVTILLVFQRKAYAEDPKERQWHTPTFNPQHADKPKVEGFAKQRVAEHLNRGLIGKTVDDGKVYLSWRLLASDPENVGFDVYRVDEQGVEQKLTQAPITATTDFVDHNPAGGRKLQYWVQPVAQGRVLERSPLVVVDRGQKELHYRSIKFQGDYMPNKIAIADLDGDGSYDFVIKQPFSSIDPAHRPDTTGTTYKLEAYLNDGTFLWRKDLGLGIEPGIWYSPYIVYDFDGDGRAEVAVKTAPNDVREADGRVRSGEEWVSILDGMTGEELDRAPWPERDPGYGDYNRLNRNQMGVAYLDGKTPCLIVARGTYKMMVVDAYQFHNGKLEKLWHWCGDEETPVIRSQ
ncbi:MAG: silent information regulator protein Sir2, partial [Limnochordia bacterium]